MTATSIPPRTGPRPRTSTEIPHSQLDQQPADRALTDAIIEEARTWPHVEETESGISVEGARALALEAAAAPADPGDRFMVGREFCHAHAQGDFSFHAVLPLELAEQAEQAGWAEPHFLVRTGQVPPTVVMIYAPTDEPEREVVCRLVRASYEYALGE